jgi:ABC-2 type transport system ATP-binding protein
LIRLEANEWINKKVQELSKGMQQKIQFIASILHDPQFIILDEPFSGFDPINAEVLKTIILDLKKEGKTIILSTHLMEQVEQLCDEIALINKGKLVLSGNVREIKQKNKTNLYTLEYDGNNDFIEELNEISIINKYNNRFDFSINDNIDIKSLINKINNLTNIIKFEHSEPKLNDIFINVVKSNNI